MWKLGAKAALFPEKEYISGIFVAVYLGIRKDGARHRDQPKPEVLQHRQYTVLQRLAFLAAASAPISTFMCL